MEVVEGIHNNTHGQILPTDGQQGVGHVEANHVQVVNEHIHHDNIINKMEVEHMIVFDGNSVQG
jgi:hypothetical protein